MIAPARAIRPAGCYKRSDPAPIGKPRRNGRIGFEVILPGGRLAPAEFEVAHMKEYYPDS